jgi:transcription factor TFIIIB component B''
VLGANAEADIDQYSTLTSQEFQDPQELEDELQKLRDEHEASETAAASHIVEAERERQEAANAAMIAGDSGIGAGAGEAHKKGRKKKGARGGGGGGGAGEEEVLMSREEYEAMRAREAAEAEE